MFSSNQIFEISGSLNHLDELTDALQFALDYADHSGALVYQKVNNIYAIGWSGKNGAPEGWETFDFRPTAEILSLIIQQFLSEQEYPSDNYGDGACSMGFLIKNIPETFGEYKGIKSAFYGIITIEPYLCFYSK